MFSPQPKLKLLALLCAILFAIGLTQLFLLRFEAGNVYPRYSSLRSDPLGTRALFDGYDRLSSKAVVRNYRPWQQVRIDMNTTLMIIGLSATRIGKEKTPFDKLLERLSQSGGRLVLTLTGVTKQRFRKDNNTSASGTGKGDEFANEADPVEVIVEPQVKDEDTASSDERDSGDGINALGLRVKAFDSEPSEDFAALVADRPDILPLNIPWRSHLYFELPDNHWETLYTWQDKPVVVQRSWGKGTVVVAADSYLLSNEAMRNNRRPGLLTWLVVPGNDIVFDESHKGLVKQPGIAGLTRQYRLQGFFAALLALAILFIWRQSAIFVPTLQSEQRGKLSQPTVGRDTGQGMVHLARHHIPPKEVLSVCFETWKVQAAKRVPPSRIADVEDLVKRAAGDSRKSMQVQTYKQICKLLKQGKHI